MPTQLQTLWEGLEFRQRIIAVMTGVAILATMFGVSRIATAPNMTLLYSGLDPAASGEVVAALEAQGIEFDVRDNSIFVDQADRDRVRMDLASEGLPAGGPAGYELLDGLTGFGTTSQMFDAAYWRAKEGELARTITAGRNIRSARVHLANPVSQPFSRTPTGSASVTVTVASGNLDGGQAEAIRYLVSSAVAGIDPDGVAVIDSSRGIVLAGADDEFARAGGQSPDERAEVIRSNVQRMLEARVGTGNAIVEVHVDANMDSQTITERRIDPQSRIAISSETEENVESSNGTSPGVTVASNLPGGDVEGGAGENTRNSTQTRERQNFEVSEINSQTVIMPGQVKRVNVAVMVNGLAVPDETTGELTWQPRPEEEMATLRQLVQTASGFDEERGDTVTIESLQFTLPGELGTVVDRDSVGFMDRYGAQLIQAGVLGGIILALIFFVLRPMLRRNGEIGQSEFPELETVNLFGEDAARQLSDQTSKPSSDLPATGLNRIERLREVITDRSEDSTNVLRAWIEAPDAQKEGAKS